MKQFLKEFKIFVLIPRFCQNCGWIYSASEFPYHEAIKYFNILKIGKLILKRNKAENKSVPLHHLKFVTRFKDDINIELAIKINVVLS
jgi:hypothetical protein